MEKIITLQLKIRVYEEEIAPLDLQTWLYQFINRLNYEHDVLEVTLDGDKKELKNDEEVKELWKEKLTEDIIEREQKERLEVIEELKNQKE
jgi:hypothetical protein